MDTDDVICETCAALAQDRRNMTAQHAIERLARLKSMQEHGSISIGTATLAIGLSQLREAIENLENAVGEVSIGLAGILLREEGTPHG